MKKKRQQSLDVACKAIAKLQPLHHELEAFVLNPEGEVSDKLSELNASIVAACMDVHTKMNVMLTASTALMTDPSTIIVFGMEEIKEMATEATDALKTLEPFM